tara:strand:+ start:1090 stop:1965 length:876 start_codon:yes stop_codon:yes gene_type:complete
MPFKLLSGIEVSKSVYKKLTKKIVKLKSKNIIPGLAVILVGNNPASKIYVRSKTKKFKELGILSKTINVDSKISETELIAIIEELNNDNNFHGILVQLPLPAQINKNKILYTINPLKDVDGFHPENVGMLSIGQPRFIPCTPKGIIKILEYYNISLKGKHIVVVGRSNLVGRPISILTSSPGLSLNGTTTICHSETKDISFFTKQADILISAIGMPEYFSKNNIKKDAVIIDVGINKIKSNNSKGYKILGDFNWSHVTELASYGTPVPGGVGPMTIAMLLDNTILAAENTL